MREFVSGTQMKQLDRYTIQEIGIPSLVLMERAARSVYDTMIKEQKSETPYHKGDTKNGLQQTGIRNARTKQR